LAFLDTNQTALKICGITLNKDAEKLISMGVDAMGINFWPQSKRYLSPDAATSILKNSSGQITRVGVFVNAEASLPRQLLSDGLIDIAQFHGDESPQYCATFADAGLPFIKAIGSITKIR